MPYEPIHREYWVRFSSLVCPTIGVFDTLLTKRLLRYRDPAMGSSIQTMKKTSAGLLSCYVTTEEGASLAPLHGYHNVIVGLISWFETWRSYYPIVQAVYDEVEERLKAFDAQILLEISNAR